jgi:hypothetical protein
LFCCGCIFCVVAALSAPGATLSVLALPVLESPFPLPPPNIFLNSEGIFDSGFSSSRCCALPPAPASVDVPQPSFAARVTSHTEEQEINVVNNSEEETLAKFLVIWQKKN